MKVRILYAIQGTGNGHLSRARSIIPCLEKHGKVDILISGTQSDIPLPYKIKYKLKGLSFIFGKSGGVDIWKTIAKSNLNRLFKDINTLPVENYHLVISDFEPVSSWACHFKNIPCIALSNQASATIDKEVKLKKTGWFGKMILHRYAPGTHHYGFHFNPNSENIYTPLIRPEIRSQTITNNGHYTVYLPAYDDKKIIKRLEVFTDIRFEVFSKHGNTIKVKGNIKITPLNNEKFIKSLASSAGIICGAGFETPSEALFLKKKLLVVPMKTQYEQQLNAKILEDMGVTVVHKMKKQQEKIKEWLLSEHIVEVNYPDQTQKIVDRIIKSHLKL